MTFSFLKYPASVDKATITVSLAPGGSALYDSGDMTASAMKQSATSAPIPPAALIVLDGAFISVSRTSCINKLNDLVGFIAFQTTVVGDGHREIVVSTL